MAISTTSATISSFNLDRSIAFHPSKLSTSTYLPFPPLRHSRPKIHRVFSRPHRRALLPRVQAKKQSFSSFGELLATSDKPVLVDFYAMWCGPCQFMIPILNQVSEELKDMIQVVKVDTEKYPSIANEYNIEALPTFVIFKDGVPCERFEGALPADQLIERIKSALKPVQ